MCSDKQNLVSFSTLSLKALSSWPTQWANLVVAASMQRSKDPSASADLGHLVICDSTV